MAIFAQFNHGRRKTFFFKAVDDRAIERRDHHRHKDRLPRPSITAFFSIPWARHKIVLRSGSKAVDMATDKHLHYQIKVSKLISLFSIATFSAWPLQLVQVVRGDL